MAVEGESATGDVYSAQTLCCRANATLRNKVGREMVTPEVLPPNLARFAAEMGNPHAAASQFLRKFLKPSRFLRWRRRKSARQARQRPHLRDTPLKLLNSMLDSALLAVTIQGVKWKTCQPS